MAENEITQTDDRIACPDNAEIENIQTDLSDLIESINNFISAQPKCETFRPARYEYTNDSNTDEKEDGPPEKCAGKELVPTCGTTADLCEVDDEVDEDNVTEVDWSVAGPVMQKHVADLERLHTLNVATSSLIRRVKKLAIKKSIAILNETEQQTMQEALQL